MSELESHLKRKIAKEQITRNLLSLSYDELVKGAAFWISAVRNYEAMKRLTMLPEDITKEDAELLSRAYKQAVRVKELEMEARLLERIERRRR